MKKLIAALIVALSMSTAAMAAIEVPGKVSVKTKKGWTDWASRKSIEFVTGQELQRRTRNYTYNIIDNYALLWYGTGQVAVVKLNEFLPSTGTFTSSTLGLYATSLELTGEDQDGDQWRICLHQLCF